MDKERQKVLLLAGLFVVVLGVGTFQMLPRSKASDKPKPAAKKDPSKVTITMGQPPDASLFEEHTAQTPRRDPFAPTALNPAPDRSQPSHQSTSPSPGKVRPFIADVQPMQPLVGALPQPGAGFHDGEDVRSPRSRGYAVTGVILGTTPAVVVRDGQDNQRLVRIGGSLDEESRVVEIERGRIVVVRGGRRTVMKLGEESHGN